MKRLIAFQFLTMSFIAVAHSQLISNFGIKAGISNSTQQWKFDSQPLAPFDSRLAATAGIFLEWFGNPNFAVSSELFYFQKGMQERIPVTSEQYPEGNNEYYTITHKPSYISILLLPKGRIAFGVVNLEAFAGPRIDFFLSHDVEVGAPEPFKSGVEQFYETIFKKSKSRVLGATVGFGVGTNISGFVTMIELRYSPDFQDAYTDVLRNVRNKSFELLISVCMEN